MEILINISLFVTIGLLMCSIAKRVCFIGCMLSILIELLQLVSGRGLCETNDVIHNTVGYMVGYAVAMAMRRPSASECNILIRYKGTYMNS